MENIERLENAIKEINTRNKKVEADKAWEISSTRKALILLFTYLAISLYLNFINIERPWLNAIVPAVGFWLSTLTLPWLKKIWIKYFYKK